MMLLLAIKNLLLKTVSTVNPTVSQNTCTTHHTQKMSNAVIVATPVHVGDLEAANVPMADIAPRRNSLEAAFATATSNPHAKYYHISKTDISNAMKSRKGRVASWLCLLLFILAILLGILYPKLPTVYINREETARTIGVQKDNGTPVRVYGDIDVNVDNRNVMDIELSEMYLEVLLGKQSISQVRVSTIIGARTIPGAKVSRHVIPVSIPLPTSLNLIALGLDLAADCLRDNKMTIVISGQAKLTALGTKMNYKFGPIPVEAVCLE